MQGLQFSATRPARGGIRGWNGRWPRGYSGEEQPPWGKPCISLRKIRAKRGAKAGAPFNFYEQYFRVYVVLLLLQCFYFVCSYIKLLSQQ